MATWLDRVKGRIGYGSTPSNKETATEKMQEMQSNLDRSKRVKNSKEFQKVSDCLKEINSISTWRATEFNRQVLEQAQRDLSDACKAYLEKTKGARTGRGQERHAMVEEIYRLHLEESRDLKNKSLIDDAIGENKPWSEVLHGSRVLRAKTPQKQQTVGGAISSRVPLEFDGRKGFFTAHDKEKPNLLAMGKDERLLLYINQIENKKIRDSILENTEELFMDKGLDADFDYYHLDTGMRAGRIEGAVRDVLGGQLNDKELKEAAQALQKIAKSNSAITTMEGVMEDAGISIEAGAKIDDRNIASFRFAALLGNPDLIARSDRMVLDGKIEGSFMEYAKGIDGGSPDQEGVRKLAGVESFKHPNLLRQLSNLEIMDWATRQIDRHAGNMFLQVDENNAITGIQGIDNDMAFGCLGVDDQFHPREMVRLKDITIVDKELRDNLRDIDKTVIDYTFGDILNEKEREMLMVRIDALNEHLSKDEMIVVEKGQWESNAVEWELVMAEGDNRYLNKTIETVEDMRKKYYESVRTPVQENELAQAEKQAQAGGAAQKQPSAVQAARTPNARVAIDNDVPNNHQHAEQNSWQQTQPKGRQQAQTKSQPKTQQKTQPSKQSIQIGNRGK